jgi:hypothetical protein
VRRRALIAGALAVALLAAGALAYRCADRPTSREAHDRVWMERMLAGRYGDWLETGSRLHPPFPGDDHVASRAESAFLTRYGLGVTTEGSTPLAGDWRLRGGVVGRAPARGGATVELVLKQMARIHWPSGAARHGRDYAYDVFLLVRPPGAAARLVRQWHIPPADIALFVPRAGQERAGRLPPPTGDPAPPRRTMRVEGLLAVDPSGSAATVTVLGLRRPFEERVDLAEALPP